MHRTKMSLQVTEQLLRMGFRADFAKLVGEQLNTDFTARQMLSYLRDAQPGCMEDIADEMLGILEFRDKCQQKQIAKGKRNYNFRDMDWEKLWETGEG